MKTRPRYAGFTLVEIMVVVTLIGLLAGMARLAVMRINTKAKGSAFINDCRVFAEAFQRYSIEKGSFPADQTTAGTLPVGMTGYISERAWLRPTPIGGNYDWDNREAVNGTGVRFDAAIKVSGSTWPVANLLQLDRWFDDGNLSSGRIMATDAGTTILFLIEGGASAGASAGSGVDSSGGGGNSGGGNSGDGGGADGGDSSGGAPSVWFMLLLTAATAARVLQRRGR